MDDNDQVIPTAIVIKNIPFSVKKDALLSKLVCSLSRGLFLCLLIILFIQASLDVPTAYAFNYHFDNGVFRGLAFANYRTPEETEIVVNTVNGLEIGGRKLRVEYKKMLPNMMDSMNSNINNTNNNNSHDNITVNIMRKKERDIPTSSQPGSPLLSERKLPTNADEGMCKCKRFFFLSRR